MKSRNKLTPQDFYGPVTTDSKEKAEIFEFLQHVGTSLFQINNGGSAFKKKTKHMSELNPFWITGFVDGEGCFSVSFSIRTSRKPVLEVRPSFSISQSGKRSCPSLQALQENFQCGAIRYCAQDGTYQYEVRSLDDLLTKILPHFQNYTLVTPKKKDFECLLQICQIMKRNLHKNPNGLATIIHLAYSMNPCGKRTHTKEKLLQLIGS